MSSLSFSISGDSLEGEDDVMTELDMLRGFDSMDPQENERWESGSSSATCTFKSGKGWRIQEEGGMTMWKHPDLSSWDVPKRGWLWNNGSDWEESGLEDDKEPKKKKQKSSKEKESIVGSGATNEPKHDPLAQPMSSRGPLTPKPPDHPPGHWGQPAPAPKTPPKGNPKAVGVGAWPAGLPKPPVAPKARPISKPATAPPPVVGINAPPPAVTPKAVVVPTPPPPRPVGPNRDGAHGGHHDGHDGGYDGGAPKGFAPWAHQPPRGVIPRPDGKGGSYHGSWYRDATGAWWPPGSGRARGRTRGQAGLQALQWQTVASLGEAVNKALR